jgi:hypothetical protein
VLLLHRLWQQELPGSDVSHRYVLLWLTWCHPDLKLCPGPSTDGCKCRRSALKPTQWQVVASAQRHTWMSRRLGRPFVGLAPLAAPQAGGVLRIGMGADLGLIRSASDTRRPVLQRVTCLKISAAVL